MYKKISDYGVIGNFHSLALIALDGSMDWLCLPHIYSPSVFGALIDSEKGGRFCVTPVDEYDSTAEYVEDTNILKTSFRTRTGEAVLTDFMTIPFGPEEAQKEERHEVYRRIEVIDGEMSIWAMLEPKMDYARVRTHLSKQDGVIIAEALDRYIYLESTLPFEVLDGRAEAEWQLKKGDTVWIHMTYMVEPTGTVDVKKAGRALEQTKRYWRIWALKSEACETDLGPYMPMVNRSALILKLLYFYPTGTMAAAATTSLPETVRGVRNWDYRFTWLRDTFFTLEALFSIGHTEEAIGFFGWIERLILKYGPGLQSVYGLNGDLEIPECELDHLDGYKGSRPVRIGNGASSQAQLDIYGELLNTAHKYAELTGTFNRDLWPSLRSICGYVVEKWNEKDYGIWEMRSGPHHFVYSKVMCWAALDRGQKLAARFGLEADISAWKRTMEEIREAVLTKGWCAKKQAFVQHFETEEMDASNLLIPIIGFLPHGDQRVVSTIEYIKKELSFNDCFFHRYKTDDGLPGKEGAFLICSFWYIDHLVAMGRLEEAETYLRRVETVSNHLGLFPEEYDFKWMEQLGNFPQAYTHLGYINSVLALRKARQRLKAAA